MPPDQAPADNVTRPAQAGIDLSGSLQKVEALIDAKDWEAAEDALLPLLDMERSAPVLILAGRIILEMEGAAAALPVFSEAVQKAPDNAAAHVHLADAFFKTGDTRCVEHTAQAVLLQPHMPHHKENFLLCLGLFAQRLALEPQSKTVAQAVNLCLETPDLDLRDVKHIWLPIFSNDPVYSQFYRCFTSSRADGAPSLLDKMMSPFGGNSGKVYAVFDAAQFDGQTDLAPLCTPFFLNGLRQLQIAHIGFEQFLTALRKRLLQSCPPASADAEAHLALCAALAVYCWETEYIFNTSAEEDAAISTLRAKIESAQNITGMENEIALYACYAPLRQLKNADTLLATFERHADLGQIVRTDIDLDRKLQQKKAVLTAMSGFENDVSLRVREQYEDFPYPRWKHRPMALHEETDAPLRQDGARILIAGCGTGREAVNNALKFPHAAIDAIDLSTSSLAYAMTKAEEFGIENIRFRHGDILHLDFPDACFDAISCHGVLHHMQDPAAGWASLLRCLKPDGLMRIGLYSEIARRDFIAAQRIIAENKIAGTTDAMKDFRHRAADLLPYPVYTGLITRSQDFYQLSPLRDLLFHAQEHRMTLPRLKDMMDRLGLELVTLSVSRQNRAAYQKMFGQGPDTFENWHKFEEINPDTFSGMYQFWCRRKK